VLASDVDPAAVALARRNARALGLELTVCHADLLEHPRLRAAARRADLLVANLPYLPEADRGTLPPELAWESDAALFAGRDGLSVARRLRAQAWRALRPARWRGGSSTRATPSASRARRSPSGGPRRA
jgi:release factor glutamine methyltransferase